MNGGIIRNFYFLSKSFLIFCMVRIREALLLQEMRAGDGFTWTHLNRKSIVWKESRRSCQIGNKHMTPVLSDCIETRICTQSRVFGSHYVPCLTAALCKEAQSFPPRPLWLHLKIFSLVVLATCLAMVRHCLIDSRGSIATKCYDAHYPQSQQVTTGSEKWNFGVWKLPSRALFMKQKSCKTSSNWTRSSEHPKAPW